jgi:stage V sporulation protein D (sporulation-specific penicillin-binding protein)
VALDTPSRQTGIYISGGVMAAPTVGAVMADILPYLGVERQFSEGDLASQTVILEDLTGFSQKDAEKYLKSASLYAKIIGQGDTVTDQIPSPGEQVPGGSQVLLYMDGEAQSRTAKVPDFAGMNRAQASETAGRLGLYILVTGNPEISPNITVTAQDIPAGTEVPAGTTVSLNFTDTTSRD